MADAYTVEGNLAFKTNALTVVADLIKQFDKLDTVILGTQKGLAGLAAELRALNAGGKGITGAAKALEQLAKAKLNPDMLTGLRDVSTVTSRLVTEQRDLAKYANETAAAWRSMGRTTPRVPGAGGGSPGAAGGAPGASPGASRRRGRGHDDFTGHDLLNAGIGLQMAGQAGLGVFEKSFMAEAAVLQQLASLRLNTGLKDADIAKARAVAEAATKAVPGSTLAENLHHLVDAFTVTGDLNEAMAGLPAVARMAYTIKNLPGAHHGDTSFASMQAIEVMQRFYDPKTGHVSMETFSQQLAAMTQVAAGTGGRVDGTAYLGFAKQSRVGGMVANDQYLYRDLPAMLISMGGNRSGTGDAAVWNQFVTGKMTANAFGALQKTGLIDKGAHWAHGQVQDMMKHLRNPELFGANRIEWMRQEILGPNGALARQKIDPNDRLAVSAFLSSWASRQTGLGFLSEGVIGMEGINKEAAKIGTTNTDPLSVIQQFDPMQKVRELQAAENQLFVTLGQASMGPAIEVLKELTTTLRMLAEFAAAHPTLAKDLMLGMGAGSVLSLAAGTAASAVFLGAPVAKGFTALARWAVGGAAGGAAAGAAAPAAGSVGTMGAAGGAGLAARLAGGIGPGVILGGIIVAHEYMKPLTEGQAERHAPWLAAPHDGFDVGGRPVAGRALAMPPSPPQPINITVTVNAEGKINESVLYRAVSTIALRAVTGVLGGPGGGLTGFDHRAAIAGTVPGGT